MHLPRSFPLALLGALAVSWVLLPVEAGKHNRFHRLYEKRQQVTGTTPEDFFVSGDSLDLPFPVCDSYAGSLCSSDDGSKTTFFWYWPPEGQVGTNDLTIVLNDVGISALQSMLQQVGPFLVPLNSDSNPVQNPYSFTQLSHVLFVDTPAGIGFSQGDPEQSSEEVAHDFFIFLSNFFSVFTDLNGVTIYFSGKGQAIQLTSYILKEILITQADSTAFTASYGGSTFFSPFFMDSNYFQQAPALDFAIRNQDVMGLNNTFIGNLQQEMDSYGLANIVEDNLIYPSPGNLIYNPDFVPLELAPWAEVRRAADVANPCFQTLNVAMGCPYPTDPLGFPITPQSDFTPPSPDNFVNLYPGFRDAIHAPPGVDWLEAGLGFGTEDGSDLSPPSFASTMFGAVIDSGSTTIVVCGEYAFLSMCDGMAIVLQFTEFGGGIGLDNAPTPFTLDGQQLGGYASERGLTFIRLPEVGYEIQTEEPAIAYTIQKLMLGQL